MRSVCQCVSDAGRSAAAVVVFRFDEALCAIRAEHELWQDEASSTQDQDQQQAGGGGGGGAARGGIMQQARWGELASWLRPSTNTVIIHQPGATDRPEPHHHRGRAGHVSDVLAAGGCTQVDEAVVPGGGAVREGTPRQGRAHRQQPLTHSLTHNQTGQADTGLTPGRTDGWVVSVCVCRCARCRGPRRTATTRWTSWRACCGTTLASPMSRPTTRSSDTTTTPTGREGPGHHPTAKRCQPASRRAQ